MTPEAPPAIYTPPSSSTGTPPAIAIAPAGGAATAPPAIATAPVDGEDLLVMSGEITINGTAYPLPEPMIRSNPGAERAAYFGFLDGQEYASVVFVFPTWRVYTAGGILFISYDEAAMHPADATNWVPGMENVVGLPTFTRVTRGVPPAIATAPAGGTATAPPAIATAPAGGAATAPPEVATAPAGGAATAPPAIAAAPAGGAATSPPAIATAPAGGAATAPPAIFVP